MDPNRPVARALDRSECLALLASTSLGRIGTSIEAMPVVLPVAFALYDGSIVFRTMPGTKLHDATRDAASRLSVFGQTGWDEGLEALGVKLQG